MKHKFLGSLVILGAFLFLLWIEGCGNTTGYGGSEIGNPDSRTITGKVAGNSDATKSVKAAATANCVADAVIATDSVGAAKSTDIAADCSFAISLATGKAFRISFNLSGSQVAVLQFLTTSQLTAQSFVLGTSATAISLGTISFSGTTATAQNNYYTQNDQDGDGIPDSQETDADGNGVADSQEKDCDLDGIPDHVDSDTSSCKAVSASEAVVYEVDPRNEPSPSNPFFQVDLTASVKARASCEISQVSVTAATFTVKSTTDTISCSFKFSGTGTGDRVECDHATQNFQAATLYTATLNGVKCSDGRGIVSTTWSFKTK